MLSAPTELKAKYEKGQNPGYLNPIFFTGDKNQAICP
jgi:hypothetical protein